MPLWGCALSTAHPKPPLPPCTVGSGSNSEVTPAGHRRVQLALVAGSRAREALGQALGEPQGPDRGIRGRGVPHPAQGTPPRRGRARVTRHQQGAPFAKAAGPILQTRGPGWGSVPAGQSPALWARSPPGSLRSLRVAPPRPPLAPPAPREARAPAFPAPAPHLDPSPNCEQTPRPRRSPRPQPGTPLPPHSPPNPGRARAAAATAPRGPGPARPPAPAPPRPARPRPAPSPGWARNSPPDPIAQVGKLRLRGKRRPRGRAVSQLEPGLLTHSPPPSLPPLPAGSTGRRAEAAARCPEARAHAGRG
uniref:Uncharacterized protein n=1 Tax=Rangifer tarandus platyrhynchus TaxID=3082113 RepID=A0ACB0F3Z8_RANTA|nr:unnamed protein product [Rangifer tarandus platyrhynchus]